MRILSHKPIITIFGSLLIIAGLIVFVLLPLLGSVDSVLTDINEKRIDLAILQTQGANTGQAQNKNDFTEQDSELASYFIDKTKLLEFISTIEDIAQKNNVSEQISITDFPDQTTDIFSHPISLSPTGSYNNIIQYIAALEKLDYYLDFSQLGISRANLSPGEVSDTSKDANIIKATLVGTSYWHN